MTNNRKDYTKLEKFSRLYECARLAYEETLEALDRNLRQYRGSSEIDGGIENANAVRNITYELIETFTEERLKISQLWIALEIFLRYV